MTGQIFSRPEDTDLLLNVLKNVVELKLNSIRFLSDVIFNRFTSVCANISTLGLCGNMIMFNTDGWKISASDSEPNVLTFSNIKLFLETKSKQLKTLDFSKTTITDQALEALVRVKDLRLNKLVLSGCKDLTDVGFKAICENQPSLSTLDIADSGGITDEGLKHVSLLSNLKHLVVSGCRMVSDYSVSKLRHLRKLEHFEASACYAITTKSIAIGIGYYALETLTYLNLSYCMSVTDDGIQIVCHNLANLEHLDLSSCGIGDKGVLQISACLTRLTSLRLSWCEAITNSGILGFHYKILPGCESVVCLHPLDLPGKDGTGSVCLECLSKSLLNLRNLVHLDLSSCSKLTDTSLTVVMNFKSLRTLALGSLPGLSDKTLSAISTGIPSLEDINLAQCKNINDAGMTDITKRLKRLTSVNISGCEKLTDKTVTALYVNTKTLKKLDVSLCSRISLDAVEILERNLKYIRVVQKRYLIVKS